jgi:hypothetical protein
MAVCRSMSVTSGEGVSAHSLMGLGEPSFQPPEKDEWTLGFNLKLDSLSKISSLNERVLEDMLGQLDGHREVGGDFYWLTLARINELALLCAGNYADNCEFRLVGDLLLNPRRVLIYMRGSLQPVTKIRHKSLTEQFRYVAESRLGVVQWLKNETLQEIKEEALLPHLYEVLENSGRLQIHYLDAVYERKTRIAALSGFLASSGFKDGTDFHQWMHHASPADRSLVESMLCRFDYGIFFALGEEIRLIAEDPTRTSSFLAYKGRGPFCRI